MFPFRLCLVAPRIPSFASLSQRFPLLPRFLTTPPLASFSYRFSCLRDLFSFSPLLFHFPFYLILLILPCSFIPLFALAFPLHTIYSN